MILLCIIKANGEKIIREFTTLTIDIESIRDLIKEHHVHEIGMESTGIYWIPVWRVLQEHSELKLINPWFIRQLPGRKTDVKDAEWIVTIIQKNLVRGSYVPVKNIQ